MLRYSDILAARRQDVGKRVCYNDEIVGAGRRLLGLIATCSVPVCKFDHHNRAVAVSEGVSNLVMQQ